MMPVDEFFKRNERGNFRRYKNMRPGKAKQTNRSETAFIPEWGSRFLSPVIPEEDAEILFDQPRTDLRNYLKSESQKERKGKNG